VIAWWLKIGFVCATVGLFAISTGAQESEPSENRLLLENEFVRVTSRPVTSAGQSIKENRDVVIVLPLDQSITVQKGTDQYPQPQPYGAMFVLRGETVRLTGSAKIEKVLVVELKFSEGRGPYCLHSVFSFATRV
jgi:hypothetical protein